MLAEQPYRAVFPLIAAIQFQCNQVLAGGVTAALREAAD
jgi:hypothetical protein